MTCKRQFKSVLTALIFLIASAALLISQEQAGGPPYDPNQGGYGQEQGGYPAPPPPQAPAQGNGGVEYPEQPNQQGYPGQPPQQAYPGQPDQGAQPQQDPSGRVARVQYMSGEVSMQPGGVNDWIPATQNRPLTTSDRIWTDKNSRAELNVGDGFIRMNSETSVTLTNVSDNSVQLELDQGTLSITVRHLEAGEIYEVDTPNYAFTVMKPGSYRFDVYPSEDQSWVTVRKGYGEATGRGTAVRVNSDQQVRFTGSNSLQHTAEAAPARDGFDDWAQVRDKRLDDSLSARYVSPGVIGYQDLDQYGRWQPTPAYGNVWVPYSVPAGWAPYRFGHWVWIAPWGWTWVDDAPWGFAPFHYGRWVSWGGGWAWAPGPIGYWRPYYAPALVGWIGGPGFGVGFGFGGGFSIGINFGWFPLGWGEPYYPCFAGWGHGGWYARGGYVSSAYFRNVNITNTHITNITNITNNYYSGNVGATRFGFRNTAGAVTAAPGSAIASGASINRVGGAVPKADLGRGTMLRGVSVNPSRESVLGGHTPQTRGVPPASAFSRSVITANRPTTTARPANLEAANQATLARGNLNALGHSSSSVNAPRAETAAVNNGRVNTPVNGQANPSVNGRVNQPANSHTYGSANTGVATQARGSANASTQARVDTTPTSMGGRYVPRPPSAGGAPSVGSRPGSTGSAYSQNEGRTAPSNNNYGRTGTSTANPAETRSPVTSGTPRYGSTTPNVPRAPTSYGQSRTTTSTPERSAPAHQAAPPHESPPASNSHASHNDSRGPGASLTTPRSPAGSAYSAPANSASAGSSANRSLSGYSAAGGRSTYSAPSSYSSGRPTPNYSASRTYGSATPYFGNRGAAAAPATRSYGATPAYNSRSYGATSGYSSRSYGAAPATSGRTMSSYSPPRSSGGAGTYRAPSGGNSPVAHGSSGGSHSSGTGGGGHHGR